MNNTCRVVTTAEEEGRQGGSHPLPHEKIEIKISTKFLEAQQPYVGLLILSHRKP